VLCNRPGQVLLKAITQAEPLHLQHGEWTHGAALLMAHAGSPA
jgi:hypothetical protein